jgi:hypothetical protein
LSAVRRRARQRRLNAAASTAGCGRERADLVAPLRELFAAMRKVSAVGSFYSGAFG